MGNQDALKCMFSFRVTEPSFPSARVRAWSLQRARSKSASKTLLSLVPWYCPFSRMDLPSPVRVPLRFGHTSHAAEPDLALNWTFNLDEHFFSILNII